MLELTLAINRYDNVRDLVDGRVPVEGVALRCLELSVEEIFFRFARFRECEASGQVHVAARRRRRLADRHPRLPVAGSGTRRSSSAATAPSPGPRASPAGASASPSGQTATVHARGLLAHEHGVDIRGVRWFQGGVNEPGRIEGIALDPPPDISVTAVPDRTLSEMLLGGEPDAVIAAHPPAR